MQQINKAVRRQKIEIDEAGKKHANSDVGNSDQHRNPKNRVDPEEQNRRKHSDPFQQSK
jgi:hypothetical protein